MSEWISVAEKMPEHGRKVLAAYKNRLGKWRTILGHYLEARKEVSTGDNDEGMDEYDDATDEFYLRAGWYENIENWGDYTFVAVHEGTVSHWMLLPEPPQEQGEEDEKN